MGVLDVRFVQADPLTILEKLPLGVEQQATILQKLCLPVANGDRYVESVITRKRSDEWSRLNPTG